MATIPGPEDIGGREASLLDKSESQLRELQGELDDLISGAKDFQGAAFKSDSLGFFRNSFLS